MTSKPFPIAIIMTVLSAIPLFFLSQQSFSINTANLPLLSLSLFIISLISAYWGSQKATSTRSYTAISSVRELGNVKWFNANKGFGFITRDSGDDIFVHFRSIQGEGHRILRDGQRVEFIVSKGDKGLQAEDVAVAK